MTTYLWEMGCEEIPAGMLPMAIEALGSAMTAKLTEVRLIRPGVTRIETHGTPRRLMVAVEDFADQQAGSLEERRGPPVSRAFAADGTPTQAAQGFAQGCGVEVADLNRLETPKGTYLAFTVRKPGRSAAEIFPEIMGEILEDFPWPKSQRWGSGSMRFIRPISWMLALLDGKVVPFATVDGLQAGGETWGHRFMARGPFPVRHVAEYKNILAQGGVVLSLLERKKIIADGVNRLAMEAGGRAVLSPELLTENAGLTEWPVPLLGHFDRGYLEIPPEVLTTSMKNHQKYFPVEDDLGKLMPCFVAVSNMAVPDPSVLVRGYERVLRARLEDAKFYWTEDRKTSLVDRRLGLKKVVFQAKLGTLYEKSVRMEGLAVQLAQYIPAVKHIEAAAEAARLAKCDLISGMVGEFPELQGVMGSYYALSSGNSPVVASAIREHYRPQGAADNLPTTPTGCVVSMADKLDTLVGCFGIGLVPSGTKDPFALRRAALGVVRMILAGEGIRLPLRKILLQTHAAYSHGVLTKSADETAAEVLEFFYGRLQNHLKTQGFDYDLIDAVQAYGLDDLFDVVARVQALADFKTLPSYAALVAANKRIANILSKAGHDWQDRSVDPARFVLPIETELYRQLATSLVRLDDLVTTSSYGEILKILAELRGAIDRFFDDVLVMDPDDFIRVNRLALLASVRGAFGRVADVSRLVLVE